MRPQVNRLQILGGGNMGEALLGGLLSAGWATIDDLRVVEVSAERREALAAAHPGLDVGPEPVGGFDCLLAVKPGTVPEVAARLGELGVGRVLSIAAGVTIADIEAAVGPGVPVVRAMPNTPALVGVGMAAIAGGTSTEPDDLEWARQILEAVGTVVVVDEADLDAVTGVSGSGPAYVFLLAEALGAAAEAEGLAPDVASVLVERTLLGAATLLARSADPPAVLRRNVTSPGGTTAAGLAVFDDADFTGLVARVVHAATVRSRELGLARPDAAPRVTDGGREGESSSGQT